MFKLLKQLLINLQLWYSTRKFTKEVESEINFWLVPRQTDDVFYLEETQQHKYQQALLKLKTKVNELVLTKDKVSYDKALKSVENMIALVNDPEEDNPHIKTLRKLIIYKDKDIQDKKEHAKMIQTRIGHYYELQDHKIKREMSRKIRKLEQEGKLDEASKLTEEWKKRYMK